jgi:hypothetical protein
MQAIGNAIGHVYFTYTGTTSVQIPSHTVVATANNINFVTTANAQINPQDAMPVPIQASNQGTAGNVPAKSITVIPPESLTNIAQATPSSQVTADSLKTTLTVNNPEATTGGEARQVPAVTQQDLDSAKNDLHQQLQADIDTWMQQLRTSGLVGQLSTTDTLINPPAPDTPAPDTTFPMSISVNATVLVAPLNTAQSIAQSQLNSAVQADQKFGRAFTIIGDPPTIEIDLTQQKLGDGNTVTVSATGQVGPRLDKANLQEQIKGKSPDEARNIVYRSNPAIKKVDIQTPLDIFSTVSPWADQINVIIEPAYR